MTCPDPDVAVISRSVVADEILGMSDFLLKSWAHNWSARAAGKTTGPRLLPEARPDLREWRL
jgi:hypothetical protein